MLLPLKAELMVAWKVIFTLFPAGRVPTSTWTVPFETPVARGWRALVRVRGPL
jgi:hypothetical protein